MNKKIFMNKKILNQLDVNGDYVTLIGSQNLLTLDIENSSKKIIDGRMIFLNKTCFFYTAHCLRKIGENKVKLTIGFGYNKFQAIRNSMK